MRWWRDLTFRIRALLNPGRMQSELDEELQFHLDMEAARLEREGASPEEAKRRARAKFGSPARQRDRARRAWGLGWVRDATADARHVGRQLRRDPGFAAGVILTLALGIGANTAIFSVAERSLLRKPPVTEPDRLAAIYTTCRSGIPRCSSSWPDYESYRDEGRTFSDVATASFVPLNLGGDAAAARLATGVLVSGNYFDLVGVQPAHGRLIQPTDNLRGGAARVVVISHGLWREAFGLDVDVVGRTVRLNGAAFQVVGVAPEGYRGLSLASNEDLWLPVFAGPALGVGAGSAGQPDTFDERGNRWIANLVGRLEPGATFAQAQADMDALAARLGEQFPDTRSAMEGVRGITVDAIGTYLLPPGNEDSLRGFVYLLLGVVALSLLLASANLANLFLARATAREQEMGVRMAVGAGRSRVVRQLLTESLVLALIGGACGLIVASLALNAIGRFDLPGGIPIADLGVGINTRVLGFTFGLSAVTALFFGLAPAVQSTRDDVIQRVKATTGGRGRAGLRQTLVGVQVALCLVLLMGSGLFLRTLQNSLDADIGFDPADAVAARFNLSLLEYSDSRANAFVDDLLARVRAQPDVEAASVATVVPFQVGGFRGTFADIPGYELGPDEEIRVDWVVAESDYFAALGTRILEGRAFDQRDRDGTPLVAVINRAMAERYWSDRNPVGSRLTIFGETDLEVIGVVENPTWRSVGEDVTPFVFTPHRQFHTASTAFMTLVARTSNATATLSQLQDQFRALDPGLSLTFARTMDEQVGRALMPQRMGTVLLSLLGALALVLAAVGVFAVVAYTVKRRSRDIGIRLAIGATSRDVQRGVLAGIAVPVLGGLVVGAFAAFALSRYVASFMFEVSPTDPVTFAAICVLLIGVALVASLLPARRASRLDPVSVLKND